MVMSVLTRPLTLLYKKMVKVQGGKEEEIT